MERSREAPGVGAETRSRPPVARVSLSGNRSLSRFSLCPRSPLDSTVHHAPRLQYARADVSSFDSDLGLWLSFPFAPSVSSSVVVCRRLRPFFANQVPGDLRAKFFHARFVNSSDPGVRSDARASSRTRTIDLTPRVDDPLGRGATFPISPPSPHPPSPAPSWSSTTIVLVDCCSVWALDRKYAGDPVGDDRWSVNDCSRNEPTTDLLPIIVDRRARFGKQSAR